MKPETLLQASDEIESFTYSPESENLVLSQKAAPANYFRLILHNLSTGCRKILLDFPMVSLIDPVFYPASTNKIVLTEKDTQGSQIFLYEWPDNLGPCVNEPPATKIEAEGSKK